MSEWRTLGPDDRLQEGDEWANKGQGDWTSVDCCHHGDKAGTWRLFDFRRRVSPAEQSLVVPNDKESLTVAVCPQCGHEDGWHNIECWKQRAEKAEDGLDLIYSASGQEHGTPDTVVAGIRHMRLKIDEFIAARQQAEKERDEARIEAANYKAYGESIKSELVSTEKERDQLRQSREQRARELLEAAQEYLRHAPTCPIIYRPCDCGLLQIQKQIEDHLK